MATQGRNRGKEVSYDASKDTGEINYGNPDIEIERPLPNLPPAPTLPKPPAAEQPVVYGGETYDDSAAREEAARLERERLERERLEREAKEKQRKNAEKIHEETLEKMQDSTSDEESRKPNRSTTARRSAESHDQRSSNVRNTANSRTDTTPVKRNTVKIPAGFSALTDMHEDVEVDLDTGDVVDSRGWSDPIKQLEKQHGIKLETKDDLINFANQFNQDEQAKQAQNNQDWSNYRNSRRSDPNANSLNNANSAQGQPTSQQSSTPQQQGATQQNGSSQNTSQQNQPSQQPQQNQVQGGNTIRSVVDNFMRESFFTRNREARGKNKAIRRMFYEERRRNPGLTWDEFVKEHPLDQEAFQDSLNPIGRTAYRRVNDYDAGRSIRDEGQSSDIEDYMENPGVGTKVKDMHKLWRLLDQTTWDMRVGFFHVHGERLVTDKSGNQKIEWSKRVETAMTEVMEDFGGRGIDGQRTVFRLVRLYATMAIDRQGKMFNENRNEWSLTEQEFVDICNCIHRSIVMWGHPFVAPAFLTSSRGNRKTLRGTDMFPSGVVPRVVAEAITGDGSAIRFVKGPNKGKEMTADDLIQAARDEWIHRTQPVMEANLKSSRGYKPKKRTTKDGEEIEVKERNLVAQKVAIENALQAFARLDGVDAKAFGSMYNIDSSIHYKLWEYQDTLTEYATVMNGKYDSEAVQKREMEKLQIYQDKVRENKDRKQVSALEAGCNLVSSGIKENALFWNLPIRISAIMERGVGNLQTFLTLQFLKSVYKNPEQFKVPDEVKDACMTKEGQDCVDAAYILLEVGGPAALAMFKGENKPLTQNEAIKFLHQYILREAKTKRAHEIQVMNTKLNKASQRILAGDHAFKQSTMNNFLNALMISNQAIADTQNRLAAKGGIDTYAGASLTTDEMRDVFLAHNGDIGWFLSEIIGTSAGRDALIMMNANNISQFNVVGHSVSKALRDNGIGNAAITAFLDSFPSYGVNFFYMMIPFSKTITYLTLKQVEKDYDITAADFAMGGGLGESNRLGVNQDRFLFKNDPGFYNGLKMNLMFDCMTLCKWGLCGALIGGVLVALGFEPPDKEDDIYNISKWKIGKNVGWGPDMDGDGKGDGVEIQLAYWLNDLTQWGLPNAYAIAVFMSLDDDVVINGCSKRDIIENVFKDSLSDQFDGNVVFDMIDCIRNWGDDAIDIDKTMKDPNHVPTFSPFYALSELSLRAFGKIVPGAPLYKAWGRSAALRGPEADMFTTNKTYDKSSPWAKEVGKTDYIDDPAERLIRKYSAGNWLLAAFMNAGQMIRGEADTGTGYFWHQMPTRTKMEPFAFALIEEQKMDYDHLPEGSTYESYRAQRTEDLKNYITSHYSDPEEAIRDGFFITGDIRDAAINTTFAELNALENEWDAKCDMQFEYKSEYYAAKKEYDKQRDELWDWINNWFKNDDIPTWAENYKQVLTDWEKTYRHADGTPANGLDAMFDPTITVEWRPKGNNPTGMLPWTVVNYNSTDKVDRGWSGETNPVWETDSSTHATLEALQNEIIEFGRDKGLSVGDVYWGKEQDGERLHKDDATVGERSWYADKDQKLPDSLRNINQDNCDGGIYGDLGKRGQDGENGSTGGEGGGNGTDDTDKDNANPSDKDNKKDTDKDDEKKPWKNEYGPNDKLPWKINDMKTGGKSFYSKRSYSRRGGGGSNYTPKIYSSRAYNSKGSNSKPYINSHIGNTHINGSRVNNSHANNMRLANSRLSSTRTSVDPRQVNADRAAGIGVRSPQDGRTTYLNPKFSTKGSREAYKRQDI